MPKRDKGDKGLMPCVIWCSVRAFAESNIAADFLTNECQIEDRNGPSIIPWTYDYSSNPSREGARVSMKAALQPSEVLFANEISSSKVRAEMLLQRTQRHKTRSLARRQSN